MPQTPSSYSVMVFGTTHDAMSAQKLLEGKHVMVMPTPRVITSACGISLKLDDGDVKGIAEEAKGSAWKRIDWKIYRIEDNGKSEVLYESD